MTKERPESEIKDTGIGISDDTITVEIRATKRRKDDFEAIRDAVYEVLNGGNDD